MSGVKHIAILASGSGTNAENIAKYFKEHPDVKVRLIGTNKSDAGVLDRAKTLGITSFVFDRKAFYEDGSVLQKLIDNDIDVVVLAGFLWLVPAQLISHYSGRFLNIHPALLPNYGGKGMYGHHVHKAVLASKEKISGITIHTVDEVYDRGKMIFQASCPVYDSDTADTLAKRIHSLEYRHFPRVIEQFIHTAVVFKAT